MGFGDVNGILGKLGLDDGDARVLEGDERAWWRR